MIFTYKNRLSFSTDIHLFPALEKKNLTRENLSEFLFHYKTPSTDTISLIGKIAKS